MHEDSARFPQRNTRRAPKPLGKAALEEMALAYVARFATSAGKLTAYLNRKLRERGWDGEEGPDVADIVNRFVGLGYVDDATFARAKAGGLLRRGYGERRVDQELTAAGISEDERQNARGSERERRQSALIMVRKRRFGPFGREGLPDPAQREKQIAALLRAGHPLASARVLVNAATITDAENWADYDNDDE